MSDTPITTEAFKRARVFSIHQQQMSHVASEMAKLERENAKLRQQRDAAEMACIDVRIGGGTKAALEIASAVAHREMKP